VHWWRLDDAADAHPLFVRYALMPAATPANLRMACLSCVAANSIPSTKQVSQLFCSRQPIWKPLPH
jgi:hypothetical protein